MAVRSNIFLQAETGQHGLAQGEQTLGVGGAQAGGDVVAVGQRGAEGAAQTRRAHFQRAQSLLQGFLESAADGHGFAHAFHGRGQLVLGAGEFFKGEARNFDYAVVDGGSKLAMVSRVMSLGISSRV